MLTPIKVPEHWATNDFLDLERELIGLLIESKATYGKMPAEIKTALQNPDRIFDRYCVDVLGVRAPHVYPTRDRPLNGMTPLKRSRAIRKPKNYVTIRWKLVPKENYVRNSIK